MFFRCPRFPSRGLQGLALQFEHRFEIALAARARVAFMAPTSQSQQFHYLRPIPADLQERSHNVKFFASQTFAKFFFKLATPKQFFRVHTIASTVDAPP